MAVHEFTQSSSSGDSSGGGGGSGQIVPGRIAQWQKEFVVQLRMNWWEPWTTVNHLHPVRWLDAVCPAVPMAWLTWDVGEIRRAVVPAGVQHDYGDVRFFPDPDDPAHMFLSGRLDGVYVRIGMLLPVRPGYPDGGFAQLWIGVIVTEAKQPWGYPDYATEVEKVKGMQTLTCFGLVHLLNQHVIDKAYTVARPLDADGHSYVPAEDEIHTIDWAPDFNRTYDRVEVRTNRCHPNLSGARWGGSHTSNPYYAFCEDPPMGEVDLAAFGPPVPWTDQNKADYLLRFFQPKGHLDDNPSMNPNEIQFPSFTTDVLYGRNAATEQDGRTLYQIFNDLAHADLGLGWRVNCPEAAAPTTGNGMVGATPEVEFFSRFHQPVTFADVTIPANPNQMLDLPLADRQDLAAVAIQQDFGRQYDRIVVLGDRIVSCCTLSHADNLTASTLATGTLVKKWSPAEEQAYKEARKNWLDYGDLARATKAQINDLYRQDDRFVAVYTTFGVPADWDMTAGDGEGNPGDPPRFVYCPASVAVDCDAAGRIVLDPAPGTFGPLSERSWRHTRPFLRLLPLYEGVDYADAAAYDLRMVAHPSDPSILMPAALPGQFPPPPPGAGRRTWFALALDETTDPPRWLYAEQGYALPNGKERGGAYVKLAAANSQLRIQYPYNHLLARTDWEDPATGTPEPTGLEPPASWMLDWRKLAVTVAIETDVRLRVEVPLTGATAGRDLVIEVPGAECWYVCPNTIVGIGEDGEPVRTPDAGEPDGAEYAAGVLRNDAWRLRAVGAVGAAWYGWSRNSLQVSVTGIVGDAVTGISTAGTWVPGTLLQRVDKASRKGPLLVNTVITKVTVDNRGTDPTIVLQTGLLDVDPATIVRRGA